MKYIYLYSLLVIAAGIAGCTPKTGSHSPSLITEINWEEMTEEGKPLPQPLPLVCDIAEMTTYDSMILFYDAGPILFFRDSSPAGPVPFPESSGSEFISI